MMCEKSATFRKMVDGTYQIGKQEHLPPVNTNPYPEDDADDLCEDLKLTYGDREIIRCKARHPKELPHYFKVPNFDTTKYKAIKDL